MYFILVFSMFPQVRCFTFAHTMNTHVVQGVRCYEYFVGLCTSRFKESPFFYGIEELI